MISISKTQFVVLGFVFAAVLLIPVNDAFADHSEVTIVTVDESGVTQICADEQHGSGCYTPVTATVDVGGVVTMTNTDPATGHTFTSGTVDGFAPSPDGTFDSGELMLGDSFEWTPTQAGEVPYYCMLHTWMVGTIIVQEAHADDNAAEAAAAESLTMDITSLNVVPAGVSYNQNNPLNYTRIFVGGTQSGLSSNQPLTVLITDTSNGNIIYEYLQFQTSADEVPIFGLEAPIFYINGQFQTEYNGNFKIDICAPEYDMCVQESFTINSIVEDTPADTTPPVITVPSDQTFTTTDPAGYVYDFSVSATDNVAIDTTRTSNAGPGIYCTHIELTHPIPPGTLFPVGTGDTNHVFCHATDTSGNTAQATFIVTVIYEAADTTPAQNYDVFLSILNTQGNNNVNHNPVTTINVGDSVTLIFGTDGAGMGTDYSHYRFDAQWMNGSCGPLSGITCIGSPGWDVGLIPSYTHTFDQVGYYFYDISHIDAYTNFLGTINVVASGATQPTDDITLPIITPSSNLNFSNGTGPQWYSIPTATDNIGIATDVTCTPPPGSSFSVGTTTVECSVTDFAGNEGSASFTITVTEDTGNVQTSDSLNSYTEPHSGFVFKYPDSIDGVQILSLTTYDEPWCTGITAGVQNDSCFRYEYTIKNTLDVPIKNIRMSHHIFENNQLSTSSTMGTNPSNGCETGSDWYNEVESNSAYPCHGYDQIDPGETAILWYNAQWKPLQQSQFYPISWPCQTTTSCEAHTFISGLELGSTSEDTGNVPTSDSLIISVPYSFTAYATNSTGQSYTQFYQEMANNPLYDHIHPYIVACDGTSQNYPQFYDVVGNPEIWMGLPICDSDENILVWSDLDSVGCSPAYGTLLPIGLNTITCTATDTEGNTGSASFTINVIENTYNVPTSFNCHTLSNDSSLEEAKYCLQGNYQGTGGGVDVWDGIHVSAHLNSTSPTGRTLQVSTPNIQLGVTIAFDLSDPSIIPIESIYFVEDMTRQYLQTSNGSDHFDLPIPVDHEGTVEVSWKLINKHDDNAWASGNYYPAGLTINGQNIDGTTSPITIPALPSADTTPPVITITVQTARGNLISDGPDYATVSGDSSSGSFEFKVSAYDTGTLHSSVTAEPTEIYHEGMTISHHGVMVEPTCSSNGNTIPLSYNDALNLYQSYKPTGEFPFSYPVGTSIISCTATDESGNERTTDFTITVIASTYNVPTSFNCNTLSNNSSLEEAKYCLQGNYIGTGGGVDVWDGIHVSAHLNATSPTGRTLQVSAPNIQSGVTIAFDLSDYSILPIESTSMNDSMWAYLNFQLPYWEIPIPVDYEGTVEVFWKLSPSWGSPNAIMINGQNIDGTTSPITVPALPSADTTPPVVEETVVEVDTIPPFLTQIQNITLDATTTSNGAIVNYELPIVTNENFGLELGTTCTPASGSFFQTGTTEVTCSATDWVGNVGTTSFTVTVESPIAAPVEILTDVTLGIGQSQYNTDDAIFVTGIATPFTENNISIQVEDSSDNVVLVEQITPESSGIYTGIIFPNFLWSTSGNYTMSATYGNSTANTSFGFEFLEPIIDEYVSPTGITLQTDTSMYTIGDTIIIESALTDVGSGYEIGIFVEDPAGKLRAMQFLNTADSGSVLLLLKTQDNWIPGKYLVGAYDVLDNSATIRDEVYFDLVKPIPEITISPTVTTTESGDTITSYDAGDMAYFSTSLLSESTSDVLVTINVVDADDTTLGVAFFKSIVGKGDSELVLGFKIPEDAADGVAKIYVNTYTDWIDQGGIVIGSELLSEVNIDGVIVEVVEETVVEEVVEETVLPENTIPRLSTVTDITQLASFTTGSVVSYSLPLATSGVTTLDATCTPAPGSMFPIGSTQVTCTATNDVDNTGMTSFMVTINPVVQVADQSLSVKVGKDSYNNLEPLFVTGSVGTVTGEPINLEVRDTQNNLISIEQVTPKESGVYSTVLTSNELWGTTGEYTIIAKYESVIALDTFEFKLVEVEEVIPEKIPTSLFIDTLDSAYVLGDEVFIGVNLVDAGAGEPILLEVRDSQNDQVLIQSLNTDSDGWVFFAHQLDSSGEPGVYSVTATSDEWSFTNSENFIAVAQIPDITIGDVVSTLQDGTEVDSFESGDMGYFQTPIISESVSDVLITVNIFDVENTPLGLAYFNSKVVDDSFDITLGLQIPQDAAPGLATVYINTYTDWVSEGGVPILEEQISFVEIVPFSTASLTVSSEESESTAEVELVPITGNISVNTESTSYTTGNTIVISGSIQNLTEVEQPVVIIIVSPDGNFITIDQVSHDSSGNYSTIVTAGGTMNSSGEYEIRAQYGVNQITSTFDFTRN